MKKSMTVLALALAMAVGGCGGDAADSDEYRALSAELAGVEARLAEVTAEHETAVAQQAASSAKRDRALAVTTQIKEILDEPESFGTEDEIADLLGSLATETAVMDDDVFGAVNYRQAFYNTLFRGATDAKIDVYDKWLSDDGSQGVALWMWSGTNLAGKPFELAGISLTEFDDDGRVAYELVTYPYPDDYVREAFLGSGTPNPSTG